MVRAARCVFNGVERRGARVLLTAATEEGAVCYEAAVTFFPHTDDEDFAVSYDACAAKELYRAEGRRSRKREAAFMEEIRAHADELAAALGGVIEWDEPLSEARFG